MSQDSARRMVSFQQESTNLSQAYFSIVTSLCLSLVTRLCKTPMGHFGWNCHKIILLMSQAYKMSTDCRLWNHYCHRIFHSLCLWQDMSQIFCDFSHRDRPVSFVLCVILDTLHLVILERYYANTHKMFYFRNLYRINLADVYLSCVRILLR